MRHVVLDGDRVVARSGTLEAAHRATRRGSLAGAVLDVRRWQGLSKGKSRGDFDPAQLRRGTKVELEHTKSRRVAERIAMDHLTEDPRYYVKLARMERNRAGSMTDGDVLDAMAKAKKTLKIAETKARRKFEKEKQRALAFFDADDVGRAARHNAIRRAEVLESSEMSRAQDGYRRRLEEIRRGAGVWADLVPAAPSGSDRRVDIGPDFDAEEQTNRAGGDWPVEQCAGCNEDVVLKRPRKGMDRDDYFVLCSACMRKAREHRKKHPKPPLAQTTPVVPTPPVVCPDCRGTGVTITGHRCFCTI